MSVLSNLGYAVSLNDFDNFIPNVYCPAEKTIGGALDARKNKQTLIKVGTDIYVTIDRVFKDVDALITNPPFQTTKGMNAELKQFLKANYPLSKCDMCNAFIELAKNVLANGGIAGMVTQNSWMYLDIASYFFKNNNFKSQPFSTANSVYFCTSFGLAF